MKNAEAEMEIHLQAGQWLGRLLEPDCTDEERVACERWRALSPAHETTFRNAEALWRRSARLGSDPAIAAALREAERSATPRRESYVPRWLAPLAFTAAACLATVSVAWLWLRPDPPIIHHYATARGEQRRVDLPDGTALVLDTNTALIAHYSDRQRFIELETGQAQFGVKPDRARPFVVQAAGGTVTAVGTQFQVRVEGADAATVTLLEGAVVVKGAGGTTPSPAARLSPGEQLRFDRGGRWTTNRVDLEAAGAWTEGSLYARDWRLEEVVAEMNRYTTTPLRLADPTLADLRISGTFPTGDPQPLLLALDYNWSVSASRTGSEILLSHKSTTRR